MSIQGYFPGKTAILQIATEIPPVPAAVWTAKDNIFAIGGVALTRATYDSTNHGASFYRDFIKGVYEKIVIPFSLNYLDTEFTFYRDLMDEDPGARWWSILWPDDSGNMFVAEVTKVEDTTPRDERITFDIELTVSGEVTYGVII